MNVRDQLLALNEELRRLKAEGRRNVSVTEASIAELKAAVAAAGATPADSHAADTVPAFPLSARKVDSHAAETVPAFPMPARVAAPAPRVVVAAPAGGAAALPAPPPIKLPDGDKRTRWNALREIVLNDSTCRAQVYAGKQVVFGVGNIDAAVMFVGEAPGGDEEDQGEPFVGRAGQLLNRMIKAMGLERSQVYIGNILNWRPAMGARNADGSQTGNRPPTAEEMAYCLPYIRAQIAIIQPKVLVALGKTAVDGLLGFDRFKSMGAARGSWHEYAGTPLRATYHPSYLLRQEGLTSATAKKIKRDAWADLLAVMERAQIPISEKQRNYFL
ncbi:MAG TPA: uracil-DNA glycosylase [Lacunisphaera sp.]|nr:uracil-DNA glycosylase [Lacunisphaera sp.]